MDQKKPDKNPYVVARDKKFADLMSTFDEKKFEMLGAVPVGNNSFLLPLLHRSCKLNLKPFKIEVLPSQREPDIECQVLMLDYLSAQQPVRPRRLVSFADFPRARGYLKPFNGRVLQRLTHTAGTSREKFEDAARRAGGEPAGSEPARFLFRFFPLLELQAVRYEADEDFPTSCNLLFSDNATQILSVESVIVCAEKLVSILQGQEL